MGNHSAISELELVEKDLIEKLSSVQNTIGMLKSMYNGHSNSAENTSGAVVGYDDFDKRQSFRDKFLFVLKKENKFLHVRQMAEILLNLEPKGNSMKITLSRLSVAITYYRKNGSLVKFVDGGSQINTYWGSKNWLDADGNIKEDHKFQPIENTRKRKQIEI